MLARVNFFAKVVEMAKIGTIIEVAEIAKIAETEIVILLKAFKIWVCFWNNRWVFRKKLEFYSKSLKVENLL